MKTLSEIKKTLIIQKSHLQQTYGVKQLGIFGSYSRHQQRANSDLDLLIELERPVKIGLIGLIDMEQYLSELLDIKVDIALKKNLRRRIGKRILGEVVML